MDHKQITDRGTAVMKVFITRPIPEVGIQVLESALGAANIVIAPQDGPLERRILLDNIRGVSGIMSMLSDRMDAEVMDVAGPQLKVIANFAVGYDNIDIAVAKERHVHATNTPGVLTEATADLAWTLIMCAARRAGEGERFLRNRLWQGWGPQQLLGVEIHGQTLGIFGMGRIGQAVARRARGFDMKVIYHDAQPLDREKEASLNANLVTKEELLHNADVLSIHCPLTPETRHAFTLNEFRAMKPTAIVVNTARGPVIKEDDLCIALQQKIIFAAGLDVYEHEPKVDEALLNEERVVLLPHLGSATIETRNAMARTAAENIIAALTEHHPPNCLSCCQ